MVAALATLFDHSGTDTRSRLRFDHLAITSIFGDPKERRVWSGAPFNLAQALRDLGVHVETFHSGAGRLDLAVNGVKYMLAGLGRPATSEAILRDAPARRKAAERIHRMSMARGIQHVLHTGTLDLPALNTAGGARHYLYCDQNWALSLRHRPDRDSYPTRALTRFEALERTALQGLEHIFTFGEYVRQHMIQHYGVAPERVSAVACGMGSIDPFTGDKTFDSGQLLFVAKHLFVAKGGKLLAQAFRLAHRHRPDLRLNIVGDSRSRGLIEPHPAIAFHDHLPWDRLQDLYRNAALLVQPMLNDPWGQVYVEALMSRTPVMGLNRNGLPEITQNGRHGFLVDEAEPVALAEAILDAMSDPDRLARMAISGQRHVLQNYSWSAVARRIAFT